MDSQPPDIVKQRRRKGGKDERRASAGKSGGSVGEDDIPTRRGGKEESRASGEKSGGSVGEDDIPNRRGSATATPSTDEKRSERRHHRPRRRLTGDGDTKTSTSASTSASSRSDKEKERTPRHKGGERITERTAERNKTRRKRTTRQESSRSRSLRGGESSDDKEYTSDDNDDSSSDEEPPKQETTSASADFATAFGSADNSAGFGGDAFGTTEASGDNTNFEAAFGTFPSEFSSFPATTPTTSEEPADYQPPSIGLPAFAPPPEPKITYDKTPLDHPPAIPSLPSVAPKLATPHPILMIEPGPAPVANPLTGHLIVCKKLPNGDFALAEVNPHTQAQVLSAPILSLDLQRKVATKYKVSAFAVDAVLTLAVGIHQGHGYTRPRVACLMDLVVLDNNEVLRVIAVWQWGYGSSTMIQLQSVLSPPSGSDFSYNTDSLLVADSCVFVSGASAKGPCVFLCKPTVRETWSANFVGKEAARIASMAVTTTTVRGETKMTRLPYLAIALTDGTLSIWTYEAATKVNTKTTEANRRLLYPLCKLEGIKILRQTQPTPWSKDDKLPVAGES
jgi:hypothetical protein